MRSALSSSKARCSAAAMPDGAGLGLGVGWVCGGGCGEGAGVLPGEELTAPSSPSLESIAIRPRARRPPTTALLSVASLSPVCRVSSSGAAARAAVAKAPPSEAVTREKAVKPARRSLDHRFFFIRNLPFRIEIQATSRQILLTSQLYIFATKDIIPVYIISHNAWKEKVRLNQPLFYCLSQLLEKYIVFP